MQILPDGTVKIKNSVTGEEKVVKPDELPNYGVSYSKYQTEKNAYDESILNKPAPTAAELKNQSAYKGSLGLLDVLEQNFSKAKGGEYTGMGALIAGTKKNIAGKLNLDKPAGIYNREKSGFTANLKTITGDTGVMTEKDYQRIENLLPKFTDDPEMATQFFKDMRQIIANKFGGEVTQSKYQLPKIKGGLAEAIIPKTMAAIKSSREDPWTLREKLPVIIGGPGAGLLSERYRKEIVPPAVEEVLPAISLAGSIKGGIGKIVSPRKYLSKARDVAAEAVEGKVIDSKPIIDAIEKYVEKDPLAQNTAEKLLPGLENKAFTVKEALERSELWNQAYTAAGRIGKSEKAGLYNVMTRAVKELIANAAPDVAEKTAQLRATYVLPKIIKGVAGTAAMAGGGLWGVQQLKKSIMGQ